jgi:hypothetical protein
MCVTWGAQWRTIMVRNAIFALAATAVIAGAGLTPTAASAHWYGKDRADVRADQRDLRRDRLDIRRDREDLRRDWRELNRDLRFGTRRDLARDLADIRRDRRDLANDWRDLRHDRRDLFRDRHGY